MPIHFALAAVEWSGIFDRGLRSEEPLGTALPPIADDAITRFAWARHIARAIENR